MINGSFGLRLTVLFVVLAATLVVFKAVLLVMHQPDAANSLDQAIFTLWGIILGAVGLNPGGGKGTKSE